MARGLSGIAFGIGIDPTLRRYGTDFMTLQVVMRVGVIVFTCMVLWLVTLYV